MKIFFPAIIFLGLIFSCYSVQKYEWNSETKSIEWSTQTPDPILLAVGIALFVVAGVIMWRGKKS